MDYEQLLKKARENLPKESQEQSRFEMPRFESFSQGHQTVIKNFADVCKSLRREPAHLNKFLAGFTGAAGEVDGSRLIINAPKSTEFLNQKLDVYVKKFVLCRECGKPDTELRDENGVQNIKCKACAAKYPVN